MAANEGHSQDSGDTPGDVRTGGIAQVEGELNFDSQPALVEKSEAPERLDRIHASTASGISVLLAIVLVVVSFGLTRRLCRNASLAGGVQNPGSTEVAPAWHALSFLVSSFLGLNVAFGGLTAFLLNGVTEDAQSYFAEISSLKLARLSHEHFFGYGLLFGTMGALAVSFVGPRKRVVFPMLLTFAFGALDAASWWLSRYVSFGFHTLSFITGAMFAVGFLALYLQVAFINLRAIGRSSRAFSKE